MGDTGKIEGSRLEYPDTCSHQLLRRASRLRTMSTYLHTWDSEVEPASPARPGLVIRTNLGSSIDYLVFTSRAVRRDAAGFSSWESEPVAPPKLTLRTRAVIWVEPLDHWDRSERLLKSRTSRRKTTFYWHFPRGFCLLIAEIQFIDSYTLVLSRELSQTDETDEIFRNYWNLRKIYYLVLRTLRYCVICDSYMILYRICS